MIFQFLLAVSPEFKEKNEERKERKIERKRKRGDYYDPETSIYNSKSEHEMCRAFLNWGK